MIEVQGIHKEFGRVVAVDNVSFTAPNGSITALLGANSQGGLLDSDLQGTVDPSLVPAQVAAKAAWLSLPVWGSIAKIAILSCPRFDPKRNLPEG